jgi:hypothetical protein
MKTEAQPLLVSSLVVVALLVLVLVGWWLLGSALAFIAVFPWLLSSLTSAGVPPYLGRALALPAAALAAWAITQSLSIVGRKRRRGLLVCAALYIIWASSMWMMTRDYNFDPVTRAPLRKYASTPYGYETVPAKWNVHPIFGTVALPMTPQVAMAIDLQEQKGTFVSDHDALFAPDGSPLAWYCETPEGGIELFRTPGRHPRRNIPLMPITADVASRLATGDASFKAAATVSSSKFEGLQRLRAHLQHAETATAGTR